MIKKITDHVYVETGFRSSNTSIVVTVAGVVVIDTPMIPSDAKNWRIEADKYGPIKYIINTEPHTDHASGNCYLGGIVISHEGARDALQMKTRQEIENSIRKLAPDTPPLDDDFHVRLPDITYSQRMTFYLGGLTFHLINLPGHTPFQTVVYIPEEGVAFTSDNINLKGPIFPDDTRPFDWLESLKTIQTLGAEILVPGHGEVCTPNDVPKMSAQVRDWIDAVACTISQGMTLEEAQENICLPGKKPGELPNTAFGQDIQHRSVSHLYNILINEIKSRG